MCARSSGWAGCRARVYDNLRSAVARRDGEQVVWSTRFLHLRGHAGFHASACAPATPREKGAVEAGVRYLKTRFWPARRFPDLGELDEQYAGWRERVANARTDASGRFPVAERLTEERASLRPLPPGRFESSGHGVTRVPLDGYLRHGGCFYRAPERLVHERVGLRNGGAVASVKHFPGLGYARLDTDSHVVRVTATASQLAPGLKPHRSPIGNGVPLVVARDRDDAPAPRARLSRGDDHGFAQRGRKHARDPGRGHGDPCCEGRHGHAPPDGQRRIVAGGLRLAAAGGRGRAPARRRAPSSRTVGSSP